MCCIVESGQPGLETRGKGIGSLGHGTGVVAQGDMVMEVSSGEQDDGVVLPRSLQLKRNKPKML